MICSSETRRHPWSCHCHSHGMLFRFQLQVMKAYIHFFVLLALGSQLSHTHSGVCCSCCALSVLISRPRCAGILELALRHTHRFVLGCEVLVFSQIPWRYCCNLLSMRIYYLLACTIVDQRHVVAVWHVRCPFGLQEGITYRAKSGSAVGTDKRCVHTLIWAGLCNVACHMCLSIRCSMICSGFETETGRFSALNYPLKDSIIELRRAFSCLNQAHEFSGITNKTEQRNNQRGKCFTLTTPRSLLHKHT